MIYRALLLSTILSTILSALSFGQNLPSQQYDDYDLEKYEQALSQAQDAYSQATDQLRRAEAALAEADQNENRLRSQLERATRDFQNQRNREAEIIIAIQQTQINQQNLKRTIEINARDLELLRRQQVEANASLNASLKLLLV